MTDQSIKDLYEDPDAAIEFLVCDACAKIFGIDPTQVMTESQFSDKTLTPELSPACHQCLNVDEQGKPFPQ